MQEVFQESDLRAGIRKGWAVLGAFIVARSEEAFVIYMRANWGRGRGFHIIRTWRGLTGDRTSRNLQSAWCFVRNSTSRGVLRSIRLGTPSSASSWKSSRRIWTEHREPTKSYPSW